MQEQKPKCGIVMPISSLDDCDETHWAEVLAILIEAIEGAGFDGSLVSNADEVGIIHKRIIQNLYDNPVVVCDVSGKNPNVMFELGLRLAFDKPTVIIKDEKTSYSFDTSAIEHLEYPRDLRFSRIVEFKQRLSEKIKATHARATTDPAYTTFLKHFGEFTVAKLDKKEVSGQEFILDELQSLRKAMGRLESMAFRQLDSDGYSKSMSRSRPAADVDVCMKDASEEVLKETMHLAEAHPDINNVRLWRRSPNHTHILADLRPGGNVMEVETLLRPKRFRRGRSAVVSDDA
jgi:hypothetical protein